MQFITLRKAGREGGWLPGSAASRKGHSQSALDVGPALTPRPALRPGTPNLVEVSGWLGGRHQPGSRSPGHAPRSRGGPGTGRREGEVQRLARASSPPLLPWVGSGRGRRAWRARRPGHCAAGREAGLGLGAGAARLYRLARPRVVPRVSGQARPRPCALHAAPRAGLQGLRALSL